LSDIVITEFMNEKVVGELAAQFEVTYDPTLFRDTTRLSGLLADARALIVRNQTQVNSALLDRAPRLRAVGRLGVGLDNIDTPGCRARSIEVFPATGANARAVAEYVLAVTIMLLRGAFSTTDAVAGGRWPRELVAGGLEAKDRTMGLIGFGEIGQLVASIVKPIGMQVAVYDPAVPSEHHALSALEAVRHDSLDSLLSSSDVVSLHIPLNEVTRGLLSSDRIESMKPGSILINTARGGIVDEGAALAALRSGRLRGLALDVFEREPLDGGRFPEKLPGLILTPHIAGLTSEANDRVSMLIAQRVKKFLGESL